MPLEPEQSQDAVHKDSPDIAKTTGESLKQGTADSLAMHAALGLLGLCGVAVVLLCTSRYGVGLSPDSANYLSAARSLLAGQGYRYPDGGIYTHWPPLYPTLLAAAGLAGVDPLLGARLLNSLAFGLIILLSGRLFLRCTTSRALALAGTLSVLASSPLLACSIMAWSEPIFIVLTILFLLYLPGFLRRKNLPALVLVSILAGLACLQRYAGVTLILAGAVLIALNTSRASLFQRLKYLVIFGVISTTPVAVWCLRNRVLAEQTVGGHDFRLASGPELVRAFRPAAQIVATWLFPWDQAGSTGPIGLGLVLALAGTMIILPRMIEAGRRRSRDRPALDRDGKDTSGLLIWSATVFGLVHFSFLVFSTAGLGWNPEQRHIVPIYISVMVLMVAGIEGACRLLSGPLGHARLMNSMAVLLCALWLQYPLRALPRSTAHHVREGAGEYCTSGWQDSPLVQWLRSHPLPGRIYSNAPDAVYILTGAAAGTTPHYSWDAAEFARRELVPQASYVVWFHGLPRAYLYDLRELLSRYRMQEMAVFPHGGVYQYLGEGGPGVAGVYRFWSAQTGRHFYTIQKAQRDRLVNQDDGVWACEGPAFYAFAPDSARPPDVLPVYRFWSAGLQTHFYTMDEAEKDRLLRHPSGGWTWEGVVFYAWPQAGANDVMPVHRFWSQRLGGHFYTISESERASLVSELSHTWIYEGIAWYAYGP
jgi:4-amino-4-deoxy-L-arabinose transferase-like glycosyltransferase